MKTTCELVSTLILPTIRAWIAKEAIEKFGMKQKDVAEYLGITKAAVSQYMKKKRGNLKLTEVERERITPLIDNLVKKIASNETSEFELMKALCKICYYLRISLTLCRLHIAMEPGLKKVECKICEGFYNVNKL
ncbi:MAG: helix-turn-helix domain-containing protein [Nitrososphaerota archaeon]|nr:helix-turn-helix domain-containing protein [Nitrososphaerota archaeon]